MKTIDGANKEYVDPQQKMSRLPNYYQWVFSCVSRNISGKVIDLGCGSGLAIPFYQKFADKIIAIDFNQALLDQISTKINGSSVRTMNIDLRQPWAHEIDEKVDTIIMLDIVEHFENDVRFLANARDALSDNGVIIFKVPAQRKLFGSVDEASGHYRRYDYEDIIELLERANFGLIDCHNFNKLGAIAYKLKKNKKKNFSRTFADWQLSLINFTIPLLKVIDNLFLAAGQSFIVVARKNAD